MRIYAVVETASLFWVSDYGKAVVEPIVRDLLERFDDEVAHFTIAVAAPP
jgi:hypothetical protein